VDEAQRIRREAEDYAEATRRRADAFAEARIRRLRELSDRLIATAESVDRRFGEALTIKEQLDELAAALGQAAERAARELHAAAPPPVRAAAPPHAAAPAGVAAPTPRPTPTPIEVRVQDVRGSAPPSPLS
jgi:hypothetical protein